MPIRSCSDGDKPGYKWGDSGKCYLYTAGDEKSIDAAKMKAQMQGVAARANGYEEKVNEVTTGSMGSGIKNPQRGYGSKKKKKEILGKNLDQWFKERWVDISRPKAGGGFESCGRADAESGKYPKCVPAARAARMTPAQIASAVRRKRTAESSQTRQGKKPINVSTDAKKAQGPCWDGYRQDGAKRGKNGGMVPNCVPIGISKDIEKASRNVPTNPALYARVKAAAKAKFDVYPSAYANAWLVREYKKRGGGYRVVNKSEEIVNKIADDLDEQEAVLADMLIAITLRYGKFNEDETGVWAGYDNPAENDIKDIGVKCSNCILYEGNGVCKIIAQKVEDEGKCRFAIIPDGVVEDTPEDGMDDEESMIDYLKNKVIELFL